VNALSNCFLYGIVDLGYVVPDRVATVTTQLIDGGIDILQLRAKQLSKAEIVHFAETMLPITRSAGIPLIVNDHPDLLRDVDADGCHLGQEDLSIDAARGLARRGCILGKSTHSLAQAVAAEKEGADYIGFGPLFPTATKPDAKPVGLSDIRAMHEQVRVPIFCIGGIKLENLPEILLAGCTRVCIVSELLLAPDVGKRTREVKSALLGQAGP
jgi:thiamine-phosphate pyrophosphorylase